MKLLQATDADNERLLHFFSQNAFPGAVDLRLRRMFNFFNQYRIQTDDSVTYILVNNDDQIEATATLLFRKGWLDGVEQTIGYATDLRVSQSRKAILQWSHHFLPVIETERSKRDCKYIFSVVTHSQRQAYNALIRPRNLRRRMPRYHLFRKFNLVSIHGLWPFHKKPLPGIKISQATEADFGALAQYIVSRSLKKPLHYQHTPRDFAAHMERWRDLYLENFLLAKNFDGDIVGCVAPWSPAQIQRLYALRYSPTAENLRDVLRVLSVFGVAHPLPQPEGEIPIRYMNFLNANNPDITYALLFNAFQRSSGREHLVYPHFDGYLTTRPSKAFISASQKFGLYCILSPNDPVPDFLRPGPFAIPPEFEAALI